MTSRCTALRRQEHMNKTLLRDLSRRQRRAIRAARNNSLTIVDALYTFAPSIARLADRSLDLKIRQLEEILGVPDSGPVDWATDAELRSIPAGE
jgi:hypothetical protein